MVRNILSAGKEEENVVSCVPHVTRMSVGKTSKRLKIDSLSWRCRCRDGNAACNFVLVFGCRGDATLIAWCVAA